LSSEPRWQTGSWLRRLVLDPLEEVARLAAKRATHCVERAEPDGFGSPVLEDSDVGGGEPDLVGELADAHLPLRQLDVDAYDDRHSDDLVELGLQVVGLGVARNGLGEERPQHEYEKADPTGGQCAATDQ
jgi:hypothetical protein